MDHTSNSSVTKSSLIQNDWHTTAEGDNFLKKLCTSISSSRRLYGVLERPAIFDGIEEVTYKVLFVGKSGVGKTTTIANLAGVLVGHTHIDTIGIEVTDVYWPVKIWDKIILFKLQCWDAGDTCIKKYSYVLESCQDKVDLRVFMFSYNDASSFAELPVLINSFTSKDSNQVATLGLGIRGSGKVYVSSSEIKTFNQNYGIEISTLSHSYNGSGKDESHEIASFLNGICEVLWLRDQHYILNNSVTV